MVRRSRSAVVALATVVAVLAASVGTASAATSQDIPTYPGRGGVNWANVPITGVTGATNGGHMGIQVLLGDGEYDPCGNGSDPNYSVCDSWTYYSIAHWSGAGTNAWPTGNYVNNADNEKTHDFARKIHRARFEIYPYGPGGNYDPWTQNVGGAAAWTDTFTNVANGGIYPAADIGTVPLPVIGQPGSASITGPIIAATPVADKRVSYALFQQFPTGVTGSRGTVVTGFVASNSRGTTWRTGALYNGSYLAFITDHVTNTKIRTFIDASGATTVPLDLDAACFGFDTCEYETGAPANNAGLFHPVAPARIADTRTGIGHAAEPVRPGWGNSSDPNSFVRAADRANHEIQLTGVGGVPATGVSAVLANITVTGPTANGHVGLYPKPARGYIYDDQSYAGPPLASNLNFRAGQTVANLAVLKVGAGGKTRINNLAGNTHLIIDVVGWYDQTPATPGGAVTTGVAPFRLLDTRYGPASPLTPFGARESRPLTVAGVAGSGVPADATSVVLNVTAINATAATHVSVTPNPVASPTTSNLNVAPGEIVPGLVSVPTSGGAVSLYNNAGSLDLIVDIVGYTTATPDGTRGTLTTGVPRRILDSRDGTGTSASPFSAASTRTVNVSGVVPSDATAVVVNLTATNASLITHITAFPGDASVVPLASNLNIVPGDSRPNLVVVKLSPSRTFKLYNNSGNVHLIGDLVGWYR
jgi:hypothetical protein